MSQAIRYCTVRQIHSNLHSCSAKLLWETANKANVYNPYFSDEDKIELFDKMDSVKGFFHKEKPTPVVQAMKSSLVCFGYENGQNERS